MVPRDPKRNVFIEPKLMERLQKEGKTLKGVFSQKASVAKVESIPAPETFLPRRATFNKKNPPPDRWRRIPLAPFNDRFLTPNATIEISFWLPVALDKPELRQRIVASVKSSFLDLPTFIRKKIEYDFHHSFTFMRLTTDDIDRELLEEKIKKGLSVSDLKELATRVAEAAVEPTVDELKIPVFQLLITDIVLTRVIPPSSDSGDSGDVDAGEIQ
jgi:hypothetical protein